jgi:hypothetical protein
VIGVDAVVAGDRDVPNVDREEGIGVDVGNKRDGLSIIGKVVHTSEKVSSNCRINDFFIVTGIPFVIAASKHWKAIMGR